MYFSQNKRIQKKTRKKNNSFKAFVSQFKKKGFKIISHKCLFLMRVIFFQLQHVMELQIVETKEPVKTIDVTVIMDGRLHLIAQVFVRRENKW